MIKMHSSTPDNPDSRQPGSRAPRLAEVLRGMVPDGRMRWQPLLMWLLGFGLFLQLAGLAFVADASRYAVQVRLWMLLPALGLLIYLRAAPAFWRQSQTLLLLALLAWAGGTAWWHGAVHVDPGRLLGIELQLLLYVFGVAWLVRRSARDLHWAVLAAVVVVALCVWASLLSQWNLQQPLSLAELDLRELGWPGMADLEDPLQAGLYYASFCVLLLWLFLRFDMTLAKTLALGLLLAGLLLCVALTSSRIAWIALGASALVLLSAFNNRKSQALLIGGAALLILVFWQFWPQWQDGIRADLTGRALIWREWLQRLPDFWLLGAGAGGDFYFDFHGSDLRVLHAHNQYLQFWFEYGAPGILLLVALLLSLLWKGIQCQSQPLARLGLALLVFALVAMLLDVDSILVRPGPCWALLWLPVGLLLGVSRPGERSRRARRAL